MIESESDDTGSSVSTIIERFSRTSTANSSFSDHINQKDIVGRVLSPFEKLERELDQKEALQAFVNKAAAVLMADEDLRLITEESLYTECKNGAEECAATSSLELSDQSSFNSLDNEGLPNVQIIVPPEEFANTIADGSADKVDELKYIEELSTPEDCFNELECMELSVNESDSIDNEIKFIDSIINEVENDHISQQTVVSQIETEGETRNVDKQSEITEKNDTSVQMEVVTNDTPIESLLEEHKNDLIVDETKANRISLEEEASKYTEVIEKWETIEDKVEAIVNTSETIESLKNSLNPNDNTSDNNFDFYNEKDLFGDIDELNREIEALEELVEYEIKMESLKASKNKDSHETSGNTKEQTNSESKMNSKQKESNKSSDKSSKSSVERENSVQSQNGNKYSPPMSLIPRRLPTVTPRKSKSFCNLTTLQYSPCKSPDKKPSLIPRPVSASRTNLTTIGNVNVKSESPKQNRTEPHFMKVQNSKIGHKSKTRILSERKKNEVMNSSNEYKRTVYQPRSGKSGLKCKSMMDLTTAFSSGKYK